MAILYFLHQLRSRCSTAALQVIVLSDADDVIIDRALRKAGASVVAQTLGDFDQLERAVDGLKRKPRPLANGPISVTVLRAGIHAGEARFTRWTIPAACRSWPRRCRRCSATRRISA